MKIYLLLVFSLLPLVILGNKNQPDSLKIEYYLHWYPFGENGVYYYHETFIFKKSEDGNYTNEYKKVTKKLKNDSTLVKTINRNYKSRISGLEIEKFITELSNNHIPINIGDETKVNFLKNISLWKIWSVSKKIERDWFFEGNDIEDYKLIRNTAQSVTTLDSFINQKLSNYQYYDLITVDYVNFAVINIFNGKDTFAYEAKPRSFLAQPFVKANDKLRYEWTTVYNYNLNVVLLDILPKRSLLKKRLSLKYREEEYIEWYIKNFKW